MEFQREPLGGSPVQVSPHKVARLSGATGMDGVTAEAAEVPVGGGDVGVVAAGGAGGVLPPVAAFPFGEGGGFPGADGDSFPGAGGVAAGSAEGAPKGFVAAAVGPSGGGLVGGAVEGGVGLVPAESIRAGQGVTQEREAEEERRGKGVRQEVEFQGGLGSGGKGGKGGWEESGFQGGSDPWGGWHDKGLSGQVPILESPPGFGKNQSGQKGYQGIPGVTPYPKGDLCLEDLFREVRAGNTNVDSKFNQLQLQFASFQREFVSVQEEFEQIKGSMVP